MGIFGIVALNVIIIDDFYLYLKSSNFLFVAYIWDQREYMIKRVFSLVLYINNFNPLRIMSKDI